MKKTVVTESEYKKIMVRINELTSGDPDELPDELLAELDKLTNLANNYENDHGWLSLTNHEKADDDFLVERPDLFANQIGDTVTL